MAELGIEEFRSQVEVEHAQIRDGSLKLLRAEIDRIKAHFAPPPYRALPPADLAVEAKGLHADPSLRHFVRNNVQAHRQPGYCAVMISLKAPGRPPGDATDTQMDAVPGKSVTEALAAFEEFSVRYQAAVDEPQPLFRRRFDRS